MYKNIDADVIIVGAGISGLTAAYHLSKKEPYLDVIILESSERIGGRIQSIPLANSDKTSITHFNVGGQWICGEQNDLLELLQELQIPVMSTQKKSGKIVVQYKRNHVVDQKRNILDFLSTTEKIQLTRFILKVEILCRNVRDEVKPKWLDELRQTTLRKFIQNTVKSEAVRLVIDFMIYLTCGVKSFQVSALFYIFFCISTKGIVHQLITEENNLYKFRVKNSSTTICDKLAEKIGGDAILTKEFVVRVKCTEKCAQIFTNLGSYRCRNVIIAVPPDDILKIEFIPPLPQLKYESISDLCSNVMTSFVAMYRKGFWHDRGFTGEIYNFNIDKKGGPIDFCCDNSNLDIPALYGLLFSQEITNQRLPTYKKQVLRQLSEHFGREALHPIHYYEKSWYNQTSRMFCWKKGNVDMTPNIEQIHNRIHWAGAETAVEWYGQLAGAVHSGMRSALEVLYDLRPAALTTDDFMFLRPARRTIKKPLKTYNDPMYNFLVVWKKYIPLGLLILLIIYGMKKYISN
ncbi:hypothetical protein JTB14_016497 [Gonioctena quinquepunctata]|nr:hypothetical protein JTB14_016497 [Gonioctena quinquepunctata]